MEIGLDVDAEILMKELGLHRIIHYQKRLFIDVQLTSTKQVRIHLERLQHLEEKQLQHWCIPNHELMSPDDIDSLKFVDIVLCKTKISFELFTNKAKLDQNLHYRVFFIGFTSISPQGSSLEKLSLQGLDYSQELDYSKVLHLAGQSPYKNTAAIIEAWLKHPEWPHLTVVARGKCQQLIEKIINDSHEGDVQASIYTNINFIFGLQSYEYIKDLKSKVGIHLMPSEVEGFGHALNEARSVGAFVITSDHPPMNEMINEKTGLLIRGKTIKSCSGLIKNFPGLDNATRLCLTASEIEIAIEDLIKLSLLERQTRGMTARKAFHVDQVEFHKRFQHLIIEES